MLATSRPHAPMDVSYLSFILSANVFSFVFPVNNSDGSSPFDGNSIILAIIYVYMDIGLSNHINPPFSQLSNNLTQIFIFVLLKKCGISKRFKIPVFSNPIAHSCGSTMIACES
jgi:hypothetical protein